MCNHVFLGSYTITKIRKLKHVKVNGVYQTPAVLDADDCTFWKFWDPAPDDWRGISKITWKSYERHVEDGGDDFVYLLPRTFANRLVEDLENQVGDEDADRAFVARVARMNG